MMIYVSSFFLLVSITLLFLLKMKIPLPMKVPLEVVESPISETFKDTVKTLYEHLDEANVKVIKYERLGTPEEIEKAFDHAEEILVKYQKLGTPE